MELKKVLAVGVLLCIGSTSFAASVCMVRVGDNSTEVSCDGKDVSGAYASPDITDLAGQSKVVQALLNQGYRITSESAGEHFQRFTLVK